MINGVFWIQLKFAPFDPKSLYQWETVVNGASAEEVVPYTDVDIIIVLVY